MHVGQHNLGGSATAATKNQTSQPIIHYHSSSLLPINETKVAQILFMETHLIILSKLNLIIVFKDLVKMAKC